MVSRRSAYRVGFIGIGKRGLQLAQICSRLANAKIVAAADFVAEHLDRASTEIGMIARYDNHLDMLQHEDLDVVIVATWGLERRVPTVDSARAGVRGIYIEKPMATSLADCDAMIEACQASGTILTVGHQHRWWPEYLQIRDAIRAGAIGKPTHGHLYWPHGRVGSFGTHMFDLLNLVIDDRVERVSGWLDPTSQPWPQSPDILDPGAMGTLIYRNGVRIAVDAMEDVDQAIDVELRGSRGLFHLYNDAERVSHWVYDESSGHESRSMVERPFLVSSLGGDRHAAGTLAGLNELISCIEDNKTPSSTGFDGRHALEIIVALHLSSRKEMQFVQLPLTGKDLTLDLKFR